MEKTKPKRLMVFGDSNSLRPEAKGLSWPGLLEKKSSGFLRVINESCEGRTTQYDQGERNGVNAIKHTIASHSKYDHILIMLGTNDLKIRYGRPPEKAIAKGVGDIIKIILTHNPNAIPIIITPPPLERLEKGDFQYADQLIVGVADELRKVSERYAVPLIDLCKYINTSLDLEADGVHLSSRGRKKVTKVVWNHLQGWMSFSSDSRLRLLSGDDNNMTMEYEK